MAAGDTEIPLQLDVPARHLAARSQHGLRRVAARAPHDQRRTELAGHQPGPDAQRQGASAGARAASRPTTSASSTRASCSRSPSRRGRKALIWAGTNDGLVQLTRDAGGALDQRHREPAGLCRRGARSATSSRRDSTPAPPTSRSICTRSTIAIRSSTRRSDYGKTWKSIAGDLPKQRAAATRTASARTRSSAACSISAPRTRSTSSLDDGQHWLPLQAGLPHAPVHWLTVQEHFNDLVVATYGRGFWILDDVTPLRQLASPVATAERLPVHAAPSVPVPIRSPSR